MLAFLDATPEPDRPADLGNLRFGDKTIETATTQEILDAARALRARATETWPPEVAAFVERFAAAMTGVKVAVSMSGAEPAVDIGRVGFSRLCELAAGLRRTVPCE